MLAGPLSADQLYMADHLGDLWRLGTDTNYRARIGSLPASLTGLTFHDDGQLLGLSSNRGIWRIDPTTGHGEVIAPARESLDFEYLDLVHQDSGAILLLRRELYSLWPELTRWDPTTATEEHLGPMTLPGVAEPIEVFSMARVHGEIWLMDARSIYRLSLPELSLEHVVSDDIPDRYPQVAAYGLTVTSSGAPWVLSEYTAGEQNLQLLPADQSALGYIFDSESRPRAVASRDETAGCSETETTLCFQNGRFQVDADWLDSNAQAGVAFATAARSDAAGQLWFFEAGNREILVKVLDGCALNDRYWVSVAATTNVAFELKVTDTSNGNERTYSNELGNTAQTVLDTDAFVCDGEDS